VQDYSEDLSWDFLITAILGMTVGAGRRRLHFYIFADFLIGQRRKGEAGGILALMGAVASISFVTGPTCVERVPCKNILARYHSRNAAMIER
jgi:hypothetical protein